MPFRCRGIARNFKTRSFIYVNRWLATGAFLLLAFFSLFGHATFVCMLRTSCMVPSPLCSRLRVFRIYSCKNQCFRASDAFCVIHLLTILPKTDLAWEWASFLSPIYTFFVNRYTHLYILIHVLIILVKYKHILINLCIYIYIYMHVYIYIYINIYVFHD